jgi:formate dehydrogenase subunit gamma
MIAPESIHTLIEAHKDIPGGLLPLLHAIQEQVGYIPADSVGDIAKGMNLSRAEVHGVITYYHFFRCEPAGKHVVQICAAESCKACGADELMQAAQTQLKCAPHAKSADGQFTLEPVYCLGLCASSPAMQVGDKLYARVTAEKMKKVLSQLQVSA